MDEGIMRVYCCPTTFSLTSPPPPLPKLNVQEARNQVGIGLSYWPASLCSLATQFQTQFLELIPCPIAGLKFSAQYIQTRQCVAVGVGGGRVLSCVADHILHEFYTLFLTRFRTYKIAHLAQTK